MNNHLRWTSEFFRALHSRGVRHAVISPGSRSTPLTLAAAIHPGINKMVILDERSAAFIALGIGKATGMPAVLICTSGTAAANYLPAIVEAKESGVPMIVLTADRPPRLRGIGSSQTVDQVKLYGDQTIFFHEAGEPRIEDGDLKRLGYLAGQAVRCSVDSGGAAHINFPFRKPLEPTPDQLQEEIQLAKKAAKTNSDAPSTSISSRKIRLHETVSDLIATSQKPLIIAGPANPHQALTSQVEQIADLLRAPLLAEPGSLVPSLPNRVDRYEQFLRNREQRNKLCPDLILRFGDQPFTKSVLLALDDWSSVPVIHFTARSATQDHTMSVNRRVECKPFDRPDLDGMASKAERSWTDLWSKAEQLANTRMKEILSTSDVLTDGHLFYNLSQKLTGNWNIMLSNSFIPRDMALFSGSAKGQFVNRGAAGIDGILSTAIGIATGSQKPTCCITGDLAFLHDSNALLSLKYITHPFLIVVVNNGGGNIFRMLPIADNKEFFVEFFETPQQADLQKLAETYSLNYRKCTTLNELESIDPETADGVQLIEIVTDSDAGMTIRKTLWGG